MLCRPDFALMVYPAYLVNETVAGDTRRGLSQLMLNVSADHPTAFLAQTEDDGVHCENSINYYQGAALGVARLSRPEPRGAAWLWAVPAPTVPTRPRQ